MQIKDEEINLRITPRGIYEVEKKYKDFDFLGLLRNAGQTEPRVSDYYMIIYTAYITVKYIDNKEPIQIEFEEFIELVQDIPFAEISQAGVNLLLTRKN